MSTRLLRAEVPTAHTWDLSDLFPDNAAWEAAFQDVGTARQSMANGQGRLGDSGAALLACLETRESLQARDTSSQRPDARARTQNSCRIIEGP